MVLGGLRRLSPALHADLYSESPEMHSPLAATAQAMHISKIGGEIPNIYTFVKEGEDCSVLGGPFTQGRQTHMTARQRKRFFSKLANCEQQHYVPGHTYTFSFYQHMLDVASMMLIPAPGGILSIDLTHYLNGQPLVVMAKVVGDDGDGSGDATDKPVDQEAPQHVWKFELWHTKLLDKHPAP
jgi:hypothetical protein